MSPVDNEAVFSLVPAQKIHFKIKTLENDWECYKQLIILLKLSFFIFSFLELTMYYYLD